MRYLKIRHDQKGMIHRKCLTANKTFTVSSSECENSFSALIATDTDARNHVQANSFSSALFIGMNAPPLKMFDPFLYIQACLKGKH